MDLRVVFMIVCLCALAITSTEGGIPKCCISIKTDVPVRMLRKVQRWEEQQSTGACDIPALRLYVKEFTKPICAHPKILEILIRLQRNLRKMKLNRQKAMHRDVQ